MSPPAGAKADDPATETPERRRARLEGIRKLIQQACSPHGDGEQAAWRACALIRKFGLDVVDPELLDGLYRENHSLKAQLTAAEQQLSELPRNKKRPFGQSGAVSPWPPFAAPVPPFVAPPPPVPPTPAAPAHGAMTSPVFIAQSKFAGRCKQCRKTVNIGDPVQWQKAVGVWCGGTSCYADWVTGVRQAAVFNPFGTP